jgi:hypothetical protein
MRFLVLIAAAAVAGAVGVVSFKILLPQQDALLMATARTAATDVGRFRLSDLNPLQWVYNYVAREISSPRTNADLHFQSAPVVAGEIKMPPLVGIKSLDLGGGLAPRNNSQWRSTIVRCSRGGVTIPCD